MIDVVRIGPHDDRGGRDLNRRGAEGNARDVHGGCHLRSRCRVTGTGGVAGTAACGDEEERGKKDRSTHEPVGKSDPHEV